MTRPQTSLLDGLAEGGRANPRQHSKPRETQSQRLRRWVGELKASTRFQESHVSTVGLRTHKKSDTNGRGVLILKKLKSKTRQIPIRLHRDLPDHESIKEVTLKKDSTGAWYAGFCIETETPNKPAVEDIDSDETVGLDIGVLSFIHDSDRRSVGRVDLSDERERLDREQRSLSRKEYYSNNWENQRRCVAKVHAQMSNKKHDFKYQVQTRALLHHGV